MRFLIDVKPPTTRNSSCREVRSEVVENIEISRRFFWELKALAISDPPGGINGMLLEQRVLTPHSSCYYYYSKFLGPAHFALRTSLPCTNNIEIEIPMEIEINLFWSYIRDKTGPSKHKNSHQAFLLLLYSHALNLSPHHHTPPKDATYDITCRSQRMRIYCGGLEGRACKSAQRTASHTPPATSIGPAFIAFLLINSTYRSSLHPHSSEARIPVHNNPPCAHLPGQ